MNQRPPEIQAATIVVRISRLAVWVIEKTGSQRQKLRGLNGTPAGMTAPAMLRLSTKRKRSDEGHLSDSSLVSMEVRSDSDRASGQTRSVCLEHFPRGPEFTSEEIYEGRGLRRVDAGVFARAIRRFGSHSSIARFFQARGPMPLSVNVLAKIATRHPR